MECLNEQSNSKQQFSTAFFHDTRDETKPLLSFLDLLVEDDVTASNTLKTIMPRRPRVAFTDIRTNGKIFWNPDKYTTTLQNSLYQLVTDLIEQLNIAVAELRNKYI